MFFFVLFVCITIWTFPEKVGNPPVWKPPGLASPKFAFWRGSGRWTFEGKLPQNAICPGKFDDNKIWKMRKFYCQIFILIWEAPKIASDRKEDVLLLCVFSLLGTFPIFPGFSRFVRGLSGDFPNLSFSSFSAHQRHLREQSRKGPRHNLDLSPKKMGNPPVWKPPGLASPNLATKPTMSRRACYVKGIAQSLMGLLPLCSYPVPGRAAWPCESEDAGYNRQTDTVGLHPPHWLSYHMSCDQLRCKFESPMSWYSSSSCSSLSSSCHFSCPLLGTCSYHLPSTIPLSHSVIFGRFLPSLLALSSVIFCLPSVLHLPSLLLHLSPSCCIFIAAAQNQHLSQTI